MSTSAKDQADGDQTVSSQGAVKIVDTVSWSNLAPGSYVVNGTLVDKATGEPVESATMTQAGHIEVTAYKQNGTVEMVFSVPEGVLKPGAEYVVFEDVFKAADADANGVANKGATPVAQHRDKDDAAQTVVVDKPKPSTPESTPNTPTPTTSTPTPTTPESSTPTPTPTTPCDETPTPTPSTSTPGQPATPTGPGETTPNQPTSPSHPECQPKVKTSAVDAKDGDKMLAVGADGKVRDQVTMTDFAKGEYVVVGTLMDKATGQPVPGAAQVEAKHVTIANDHEGAEVTIEFTVPGSQVKENASLVVFERVYRAQDVDANGQVKNGAQPYATHTDINDKAQTVTVKVPKGTTTTGKVTPKPQAPIVKVHRFLAKTGVNAGVMAAVAAGVILAGFGLAGLRRRDS